MLAIIEIYLGGDEVKYYEEQALKRYDNLLDKKARAYYDLAKAMFENGIKDEALDYVERALSEYPRSDKEQLCEFLIDGVKSLIEYGYYDLVLNYIEEVLDLSIELELVPIMEKAYYYKAMIFERKKNYIMAETYMMLSLDALMKYGTKSEICKRYMKIGTMYHDMGNVNDSIKYFSLAFKMDKSFY